MTVDKTAGFLEHYSWPHVQTVNIKLLWLYLGALPDIMMCNFTNWQAERQSERYPKY